MWRWAIVLAILPLSAPGAQGAPRLTHGPIVGHTTSRSATIWVRADGPCELRVRAQQEGGGEAIVSPRAKLVAEDNFCGTVQLVGLSPNTVYRYTVLLDGEPQRATVEQWFRTFPRPGTRAIIRVGFGHSLARDPGEQITWRAVDGKRPDLFILMGDNIYSNTTDPAVQRRMYLNFRADRWFAAFAAHTPIYAIWDDHDYGENNSDRRQRGKERSLKTFFEIWPNPAPEARHSKGIWSRFVVGRAEFFLLDVRYNRSPDNDPDGPQKTMLGREQRQWLVRALAASGADFKFLVSGSSWNCGGQEAWNHRYAYEYDWLLEQIRRYRVTGIILLGGDQHACKISVRPGETWDGYDLHEWMAGRLWERRPEKCAFGMITMDTTRTPATAKLEFFDLYGKPKQGRLVPYTPAKAPAKLWDELLDKQGVPPEQKRAVKPSREPWDGEIRPSGGLWKLLPKNTGEVISLAQLQFPR